jgi:branched-chain amino acid transport system substrate-binding protein
MDGRSGRLAKIDAHYGVIARPLITRPNPAYDLSRDGIDPISVAAGFGSVWVTDGSRTLIRIDQATAKVIGRKNLHARLNGVAVGAGAVWAISGPSATVFRVDRARKRTIPIHIVPRPGFSMPYPLAVEAGAGFVWVLNGNSADVTQIDPASSRVLGTVPIGIEHRPLRLAVGAGAAWVADADGSLARIDPGATTPKFIPVAHGLKDVAVAGRAVWVTAGSGLSPNLASSSPGSTGVVKAVPRPSCTPIYYQGREPPRYLIASDLALSAGVQIDQAIRYVLRQHRFRAGPYAVAYQSCDDWTPGGFSARKPASNARAYAADRSVIAVIGPVGSPQTQIELPILNRAPGGALAMVNGWNTVVGLTHSGPGTAHDEPARYYPTGTRNYVRVVPADDVQGVADALAARKLGAKRVYLVILAFPGFTYGSGVAAGFRSAAAKLGIAIAGSYTEAGWSRRYKRLAARIKRTRADAVFLATTPGPGTNAATLIEDLRAGLGRRVALLAPDSFADFTGAGAAGEGLTYSIPGLPEQRLPAPGRKFVAGFSATIGTRPDLESVHAAGATEVLLSAIARSNGTRGSVARGLFSTRVRDGILGSFSIDRNGDTTASDVTIYRIARGAPRFFTVIRPPRRLIE